MKTMARWILVAAVPLWFAACGDDGGDEEMSKGDGGHEHHEGELPEVDCSGDVPAFDEVAALDKCTECHSSSLSGSERNGAPVGFDWDDEDTATTHAEHIAQMVADGVMPPAGSGVTLTNTEKQDLYLWALCM